MTSKISFQNYDKNLMAKAVLRDLPISRKFSVEIMNAIRNKKVDYVLNMLQNVIEMKQPIALRRFTGDVGHKKGNLAAGRYPVKASTHIKKAVDNAKKNAIDKGFSENLIIIHASALKGTGSYHYGRNQGREQKSTTIEIVIKEAADKVVKKTEKKKVEKPKVEKQPEVKAAKVEKKEQPKVEKKEEAKVERKVEPKVEKPKEEPKAEIKEQPKQDEKSQSQEEKQ